MSFNLYCLHSGAVVRVQLAQVHLPYFDLISQLSSAAETNNKLDITIGMCRWCTYTTLRPSKTTRIWIVCKVWCVKTGTNLLGILFTARIVLFISLFIVVVDAVAVGLLPPSLVVIIVSLANSQHCPLSHFIRTKSAFECMTCSRHCDTSSYRDKLWPLMLLLFSLLMLFFFSSSWKDSITHKHTVGR